MNILILGSGAREKVIQEKLISNHNVFMLNTFDFDYIIDFCKDKFIDLVIPSTEDYLCQGIKDFILCRLPILVFGPNEYQAQIEGSKYFSKQLMQNLDIPTPSFIYRSAKTYLDHNVYYDPSIFDELPVLKYCGLAKGKGVYLPTNKNELSDNLIQLFKLGDDGVIIEKCLHGKEVSVIAFCNGKEALLMPPAQDYKRVYDGDKGPNTGGMGAICPVNILTNDELLDVKKYMDRIVDHLNYKGILYAGLMKTDTGIYFLEFNCRFGDPEAQVILSLLETDLSHIIMACLNGETLPIKWSNKIAATVVLAHKDYPYKKLQTPTHVIYGDLDNTISIYESNITYDGNIKTTTGGRVLSMVSIHNNIHLALQNIYNNIYKINYEDAYYRKDIGCNSFLDNIISKTSIAVLASGNGTCLEYLLMDRPETIKLIITNKSSAGIITKAQAYNIPFFYISQKDMTKTEYYERIVNILRLYNIELVILAGYMKIVPDILFDEFYTVNIHPSLLPAYSGLMDMMVHNSVIQNNELFSGCTLHEVIGAVDKGRILMQKQYKLVKNETPKSLKKNIQELEKQCILEFVKNFEFFKNKNGIKYSVDIEQGNRFVTDLKKNIDGLEGFCAIYEHKGIQLAAATDGCGTKLELANRQNRLSTIGIDLVAMSVNDLLAGGAIPLFFLDYIALDKMDRVKCNTIIKGILEGCKLANCKLIGGETAEMHGIYLKNKLDLAGFAIGEVEFKLPRKDLMTSGNIIYGIKSSGPHSNGYTLINKLLQNSDGTNSMEFVNDLLEPTIIYTDVIKLWKLFPNNILGLAHITGGGFHDNIIRILPPELYFELKEWEFPPIFKWIQRESGMSRSEMMSTFNCGYGMVIICNQELNIDEELGLDLVEVEVIGKLVER